MCHCDTDTSTREISREISLCEMGPKRFAYLWWEKVKGEEKDSGFVDSGENYLRWGGIKKRKVSLRLIFSRHSC